MFNHVIGSELVSLGKGYQSVFHQPTVESVFQPQKEKVTPVETSKCYFSMKSVSELHEIDTAVKSAFSASTPATASVPSIAASMSAAFESSQKSSSVYTVVVLDQETHSEELSNLTLNTQNNPVNYLKTKKPQDFYNIFGDSFIYNVRYGKKLVVVLQLENNENNKKTNLSQSLNVDGKVATIGESMSILHEKLKSVKIINKEVFATGGEPTVSFSTPEELLTQASNFMTSKNDAVTGYETKPYSSLASLSDYTTQIDQVENMAKSNIEEIYKMITKLRKKLDKIINTHNIVNLNSADTKLRDKKYIEYKKYQKQAKFFDQKLADIESELKKTERIPGEDKIKKYNDIINDTSNWYKINKKSIKDVTRQTLIEKYKIPSHDNLTIVIPKEIQSQTKYLFLQFENAKDIEYTIQKSAFREADRVIFDSLEKFSGKGIYVKADLAKIKDLILKLSVNHADPLILNIYAVSQISDTEYPIANFTQKIDKKLSRDGNMDLMQNELTESYLNYDSQNKTPAALTQQFGLNTLPNLTQDSPPKEEILRPESP